MLAMTTTKRDLEVRVKAHSIYLKDKVLLDTPKIGILMKLSHKLIPETVLKISKFRQIKTIKL